MLVASVVVVMRIQKRVSVHVTGCPSTVEVDSLPDPALLAVEANYYIERLSGGRIVLYDKKDWEPCVEKPC